RLVEAGAVAGGGDDRVERLLAAVGEADAVGGEALDARAHGDPPGADLGDGAEVDEGDAAVAVDLRERAVGQAVQAERLDVAQPQTDEGTAQEIAEAGR